MSGEKIVIVQGLGGVSILFLVVSLIIIALLFAILRRLP